MEMSELLAQAGYVQSNPGRVWERDAFGSIDYNDGDDAEDGLLKTLRAALDVSIFSPELAAACIDWPSRYHLSTERANLLRPFSTYLVPGASVLEIGAGCGAVTRYLGETGATVLALEGSNRRARIARERTRDLDNVCVIAERFQDLALDATFDVVTLVGVLEYANLFSDEVEPALQMLREARRMLAPGGRLLLAIENQLGLKYLAGVPEDHLGQPMSGVEDRYAAKGVRTYGRRHLAQLLGNAGFEASRLLVPLPDYKMPATILSEAGALADPDKFDAGTLASQAVRRDPQLTTTTFNLQRVWPVVVSNGLAIDLANSFLFEAVLDEASLPASDVLAWHFSTQRRGSFARETRFTCAAQGRVQVVARALGAQPAETSGRVRLHVEPVTPYVRGVAVADDFREVIGKAGWCVGDLVAAVRRYLRGLADVLAAEGVAVALDRLDTVLPDSYIDATPSNLLRLPDGALTYIDREWVVDQPSLGWLLFRSLLFAYGGTVAAPISHDGRLTLRELLLLVLRSMSDEPVEQVLESALERELDFQGIVTGKDQSEAINGMLQAELSMSGSSGEGSPVLAVADMFATLQHSLNLGAQHGMNVNASIEALHSAIGNFSGHVTPTLDRLQARQQEMSAGQAALHDRLVIADDRLEESLAFWSKQHDEMAQRLHAALEAEQRQSELLALKEQVSTLLDTQTRLTTAYEDLLQRQASRRWWSFR